MIHVLNLTTSSPEIFDEYTRRQYVSKAPHRNPFGVEDEPAKFVDFDVFTKVRQGISWKICAELTRQYR